MLVWALGFEVGPALHVALHDVWAPHAHEGDAHPHDHGAPAGHGDFSGLARLRGWIARVDASVAPRKRSETGLAVGSPAEDGHGAHAIAHRHRAAEVPSVALPPIGVAGLAGLAPRPRAPEAPSSRRAESPRARGPPARA